MLSGSSVNIDAESGPEFRAQSFRPHGLGLGFVGMWVWQTARMQCKSPLLHLETYR